MVLVAALRQGLGLRRARVRASLASDGLACAPRSRAVGMGSATSARGRPPRPPPRRPRRRPAKAEVAEAAEAAEAEGGRAPDVHRLHHGRRRRTPSSSSVVSSFVPLCSHLSKASARVRTLSSILFPDFTFSRTLTS